MSPSSSAISTNVDPSRIVASIPIHAVSVSYTVPATAPPGPAARPLTSRTSGRVITRPSSQTGRPSKVGRGGGETSPRPGSVDGRNLARKVVPADTPVSTKPSTSRFRTSTPIESPPRTCPQRARDIFISIRFFFLFLVISSLVIVSVLSWNLTLEAAQKSIALVTADYSTVVVSQISSDIGRRLVAAEHATYLNAQYFQSGILDWNNQRDECMTTFFIQTNRLVMDTISSMCFTTLVGQLWGYGWYFDGPAPYMVRWNTTGTFLKEDLVDQTTGAFIANNFNDPNSNSLSLPWMQITNTSEVGSSGWTSPYLFYGNWFVSNSRSAFLPDGAPLGVITADIQLGFLDLFAKKLAAESNVGAQFIILDSKSGAVIGSSAKGFILSDNTDPNDPKPVYLTSGTAPDYFHTIHNLITGQQPDSFNTANGMYTFIGSTTGFAQQVSVGGKELLVTVRSFQHFSQSKKYFINWIFIHVLDRSAIEQTISDSNTYVLISVIFICFAFIVAVSVLLWYSMSLINHLSVVLTSFARFEFRQHVEQGQLKSQSAFTELKQMQDAVLEMTRAFKQHLDNKKETFGERKSSHAGSVVGPEQSRVVVSVVQNNPIPGGRSTKSEDIELVASTTVASPLVPCSDRVTIHIPCPSPTSPDPSGCGAVVTPLFTNAPRLTRMGSTTESQVTSINGITAIH